MKTEFVSMILCLVVACSTGNVSKRMGAESNYASMVKMQPQQVLFNHFFPMSMSSSNQHLSEFSFRDQVPRILS